jgi:hypothetical protein
VLPVAITKSDLLVFSAGLAVGAVAYATYPKWKDKLAPLISGALAGAGAAFRDACPDAEESSADGVDLVPETASGRREETMNGVPQTVPFTA